MTMKFSVQSMLLRCAEVGDTKYYRLDDFKALAWLCCKVSFVRYVRARIHTFLQKSEPRQFPLSGFQQRYPDLFHLQVKKFLNLHEFSQEEVVI